MILKSVTTLFNRNSADKSGFGMAKFSPYIAGNTYTVADCVAWLHFFMVSMSSQKIYGTDIVTDHIPTIASHMQFIENRPHVQKVAADRTMAIAAFLKK
jgi:glutathione S-transferase